MALIISYRKGATVCSVANFGDHSMSSARSTGLLHDPASVLQRPAASNIYLLLPILPSFLTLRVGNTGNQSRGPMK